MQLKITTDYAIRCVLYLAIKGDSVNSREISTTMCIPRNYVQQIMRNLREEELIISEQGGSGGYVLARAPDKITLMDIIRSTEKTMCINRCLEADHYCSRHGPPDCPVHKQYQKLQDAIWEALESKTIADLITE